MARYTIAYSEFVKRLGEVEILRRSAESKERDDALGLRDEVNALVRGAIVLLCGHLEAYVKELGEIALDSMVTKCVPRTRLSSRLYYHISQGPLREMREISDPEKHAEKMFEFIASELDYWSKEGPFPRPVPAERFNKGFSSPAFAKIKKYFNRFGYSGYQADLASSLKADFQPTITMVDHLVDTRNKIAHGDLLTCKTPLEVKEMMTIIKAFCSSTDGVFGSWWGKSFCSIR